MLMVLQWNVLLDRREQNGFQVINYQGQQGNWLVGAVRVCGLYDMDMIFPFSICPEFRVCRGICCRSLQAIAALML